MKIKTTLYLSLHRFFGSNNGGSRKQLLGAIFGIALSLIPLIVVLEVTNGMIEGITSRYLETYSYHIQVLPYKNEKLDNIQLYQKEILEVPGIEKVFVERNGNGLAYTKEGRTGITLRSLEPDMYENDPNFRKYVRVTDGEFDLSSNSNILLGNELARKLGANVGDSVKVLTTKTNPGKRNIPRISTFTVTGIISSGYQELDKMWAIIPLEKGIQILPGNSHRSIIGLKVADPYIDLYPTIREVQKVIPGGWSVYNWETLGKSQYQNFQTTKSLLFFIMIMIVVVGAVNVSSSLVMLVMERQQDIAILKSLGASPWDISLSFIFSGLMVGLTGTIVGMGLGLVIALNINEVIWVIETLINQGGAFFSQIFAGAGGGSSESFKLLNAEYYLEKIPIAMDSLELAGVAAITVVLSTIASWFPASRAGRIRPLDILRKH